MSANETKSNRNALFYTYYYILRLRQDSISRIIEIENVFKFINVNLFRYWDYIWTK